MLVKSSVAFSSSVLGLSPHCSSRSHLQVKILILVRRVMVIFSTLLLEFSFAGEDTNTGEKGDGDFLNTPSRVLICR